MITDRRFAEFMKGLRESAGLSIEEAARLLDLAQGTLVEWESGSSLPTENVVQQISRVYRISEKEWLEVLSTEKHNRKWQG